MMKFTEYGEGGYDPTKPNDNIISEYDDEINIVENELTITQNAIENLQTTLADPAINSIAKVKTALINFFDEVKEAN